MLRKFLKIIFGLALVLLLIAGLVSINHPIILKWITGSARLLGRSLNAKVYANEKLTNDVKIFKVDKYWSGDKADYYIFYTANAHDSKLQFFSVNKMDNYAGRPSSLNIQDYDIIAGFLFQSEVGAKFTPFQHDIKGFDFNPQLKFDDKEIRLLIPPAAVNELKCDSLRVEL